MKYQSNISRILLVILTVGILGGPLLAQQDPQTTPRQNDTLQTQSPSDRTDTTSPGAQSPRSTSTDVNDADRADTSDFAWGTLITGLVIGGVVGYLLGMSGRSTSRKVDDIRRDRVA
jgi:hypothetical protein